jgi:inner membrane protein
MADHPLRLPSRSIGLKFLLVCALAVLMAIPAFMVFGLIYDRTSRAEAVVQEVGQRYGGEQTFTGPVLVAPYKVTVVPEPTQEVPQPRPTVRTGWYVVFAETGAASADVTVDEKRRGSGGLFKVRTYTAALDFTARFNLLDEPRAAPDGAVIDWSRAAILLGVSDPRGAQATATLDVTGRAAVPFEPGSAYADVLGGYGSLGGSGQWLVAPAGAFARPGAGFTTATKLSFTGVETVSLVAFARDTTLMIGGDWEDVGYFGAYPRVERAADDQAAAAAGRFDARWNVPFIARNLAQSGDAQTLSSLSNLSVQVRLVDEADPYQSVSRALKYALMFIGVVFLGYFLMEATSARRVHPAQYILVGLAQVIFYLLLLALSERIGFDLAFLISAGATVLLIGAYAGSIFKNATRGVVASIAFAGLYALIYLLMRLEDYALLAGSAAALFAVAAVMYFTRNLDWYGLTREPERAPPA